ncbi:hypothetical protein HanRHA438_Chr09g0427001 [Helianthus annuus]|nr:hypothetical protein HanIR_Chr09g0446991 [Helianthus annuus]KAJ0890721.1 hypothetical protein HanRHA438_Chr09g0427001 [Helianthus annuus]
MYTSLIRLVYPFLHEPYSNIRVIYRQTPNPTKHRIRIKGKLLRVCENLENPAFPYESRPHFFHTP